MSIAVPRYLVPFHPKRIPHHFVDVLIIGGGIAGLRAAMEVDPRLSLLVITKDSMEESTSTYAQGGIAGVIDPQDELRNAQEALRSAKLAVELADSPEHRDTLAAAHAEAGAFEQAITEQQRAIAMLRRAGQTAKIPAHQEALDGYRNGRPRRMGENDG